MSCDITHWVASCSTYAKRRSRPVSMSTLVSIKGQFNGVRVAVFGMPVNVKSDGKIIFADPDLGPFLIDQIFDRQMIFATKRGLFRTQQLCRKCRASLQTTHSAPTSFGLELAFKSFPGFRLTIDLPAVECTSCGAANAVLTRALTSDIPDALLDAFQSSNISRS